MVPLFVLLLLSYFCDAEVLHLDEDNFGSATYDGLWYLEFHAPWCEICKTFAAIYEQASYDEDLKPIKFGSIDGSAPEGRSLAKKFGVTRFPFIIFYENQKVYRYLGGITLDGLKKEGVKMLQPAIKNLTIPTFNEYHDRYTVSFLYIINDKNTNIYTDECQEIYYSAAVKFRPLIPFYAITYSKFEAFFNDTNFMQNVLGFDKKAIEEKFTADTGSTLFAIKQSTNNEEVSGMILSKDNIQEFIEEHRHSPVIQLKLGNYKDLVDNTKYFGVIFLDGSTDEFDEKSIELIDNAEMLMIQHQKWNKESFQQYVVWKFMNMDVMDDVVDSDKLSTFKRPYKMLMAWCDFIEYESWASHQFGITKEALPVMLVYSPKQDGYWKYDDTTFSNNMLEFVNAVFAEKLEITHCRHFVVRSFMKLGKWYYSLSQWQIALMFISLLGVLFGMKVLWDFCCKKTQRVKND